MDPTVRKRRVVLCMGEYCNLGRRADRLWRILEPAVAELNGDARPPCIKLERATCLSMCAIGPNLVLYPEDRAFSELDEAALRQIITDELRPCPHDAPP
jgi:(2Fe-2S) ferredoxin